MISLIMIKKKLRILVRKFKSAFRNPTNMTCDNDKHTFNDNKYLLCVTKGSKTLCEKMSRKHMNLYSVTLLVIITTQIIGFRCFINFDLVLFSFFINVFIRI